MKILINYNSSKDITEYMNGIWSLVMRKQKFNIYIYMIFGIIIYISSLIFDIRMFLMFGLALIASSILLGFERYQQKKLLLSIREKLLQITLDITEEVIIVITNHYKKEYIWSYFKLYKISDGNILIFSSDFQDPIFIYKAIVNDNDFEKLLGFIRKNLKEI